METEHNAKTAILESMNTLIKGILEKEKESVGIQADEGELIWLPEHFLGKKSASEIDKIIKDIVPSSPAKNANENIYSIKAEDQKISENVGLESLKDTVKAVDASTDLAAIKNISKNLVQNWNIPPFVVLFISNSLKESKEGRVLPWTYFKKLIYDIYEERIQNSPEIYGSINSNYIPLEEFVLIYFLNKCKLRRLAEIKVIELLTSLKYYLAIWPRAKTFAQLTGFLRFGDSYVMETDTNNSSTDIYLQDYYLTCFNLCRKDKDALFESTEGNTYLHADKEPIISNLLLTWMADSEKKDWNIFVKKYTKKNIEGVDKELIDLDVLLSLYLDQYLSKKKQQQAKIFKQFNRILNQNEGIFTTEEVNSVIQSVKLGKTPTQFASYPSKISRARAFLYALSCDTNCYEIKAKHFMNGCTKFGLDAPYPFIYARVYMFGTSTEVEKMLIEEMGQNPGTMRILGSISRDSKKLVKKKTEGEASTLSKAEEQTKNEILPALNASSAMFAQHFSILRELKRKCATYATTIEKLEQEKETKKVWESFKEVHKVLDLACQFLDFPIET